ncbi:Brp/Blh family beta-carotene 15,15'-dioxygenase [Polaromonas sp. CG_9.11]|uniref:Brp/Blh family beta-carotene 15,15'-dioxygenase n=1 Tax=Polaromonas sp. CG_9.11 TaxID=2787730 RepID=UPI0018CAD774|nr:Brp/Blh family beta-carotene 15,15'-dioxygenase [Polaromonas sp. CG_9.11]MBG6075875.1 Brp/Blh family beta-carotene 15,15'-monooxygenase [Polaromonas sp. CG_9.11]
MLALAAMRYLDQNFARTGLWLFVGLTLTAGFFHGALDIVLMQREFAGARRLAGALLAYVGAVVLLAMVCAQSGWLMVLILLTMSVWHFGEPYGRWGNGRSKQGAWAQRVMAGGAPVMLPALLSAQALQDILPMAVGLDAGWAWTIWQTLAWLWVAICAASLAVFRQQLFSKPLWAEVAVVFVINLALSPLMAFSVYFGVLHSAAHIFRVTARHRHGAASEKENRTRNTLNRSIGMAIVVTSLATLLLLLILAWYLQSASIAATEHHSLLNGLLVALTAVTLPHLVLVSRNAHWLTAPSSACPVKE